MKSSSIAARAVLAVVLMVGFYLLALGIAGGLLYIPYAEAVYAHRLHGKLALGCIIGAGAILWAVLPRIDKFEAPGPQLTKQNQPKLFAEIEDVARLTGQAPPAEVYLESDVNAWVTQRGGLMGFGSRRVMGTGLALMRVLTRSQFRAVLAHEFGHFHGGDTKLGPWIYKTRSAIMRTLKSLSDSIVQLPFLWYGKMFLRITHAVSRRQEFLADELAARTIGSKPLMDGLRASQGAGQVFGAYWSSEYVPALNAGYRPSLAEGFQRFISAQKISALMAQSVEEALQSNQSDPYDTHPRLKERLAAVASLPPGETPQDDPLAISLLEGLSELEQGLLAGMAGPEEVNKLEPLAWDDVGQKVYQPQWEQLRKQNSAALAGLTAESLPEITADLPAFGQRCLDHAGESVNPDEHENLATGVLGTALLLALVERGGQCSADPGKPVSVRFQAKAIEPFEIVKDLAAGKLSPPDWQAQCRELGLTGIDLSASPVKPAGAAP